ncbi:helix-turn-helix transcriptional regulator [Roseateles oligotrophus]|uniref:LuxR C-terminal-related transcriptional regulator n=1 Tax=Roseateles oligotrophus TaxID=1769250 RepID=A0ABT2YLY0_9BURK|nr:LuxR C-terminal-related transcriptional regulator [Roseateles oligotrophus]MCV2371063.1 LuxR C-terminal-related transcriptional regulator [Roseateles oligotrophus]
MEAAASPKTTPGFSPADAFAALSPLGLALSHERVLSWVNPSFAAMFGYEPTELIGKSFALLFPSEAEFKRIGLRIQNAMQGCGSYQDERLMRRRDGRLQWFRVHGHARDMAAPFLEAAWTFERVFTRQCDSEALTPREREVLTAMAAGQTAKESARLLGLSPRTVEKLRAGLRQRYDVHNAAALVGRVMGASASGQGQISSS